MTSEEMAQLTEKINSYWQNRPKLQQGETQKPQAPVHDFDLLDFESEAHVEAVRAYYEHRSDGEF